VSGEEPPIDFDPQRLGDLSLPSEEREACWLRLHRHYSPRMASYLGRRVPPGHDVDEVIAEIWRRVFLKIHTLQSSRAMWSWLTTIGNNLLIDLGRRNVAQAKREVLWTDGERDAGVSEVVAGWSGSTESFAETSEADVLAGLSSEDREYLELYAVDGLSHEEIAQRLKLPTAAASRQRLRRLRRRLTRDDSGG
jgi:RNA polymerase sigma factor (sigma-70 family)